MVAVSDTDGAVLVGECKWSARPVGTNILDDLKRKAQRMDSKGQWPQVSYMLWSQSGFTPALRTVAESEGIGLVEPGCRWIG